MFLTLSRFIPGKTFLGVEMVMRLLENRQRWLINEPILVVCYTNQALDQFLERLHLKIAVSFFGGLDLGPSLG